MFAEVVEAYLLECFGRESAPRVAELAFRLGLPQRRLYALFCEYCDASPGEVFKTAQVQRAKALLRESTLSTTEIAYRAAFGTRRTFFRLFKGVVGCTPDEYRRARPSSAA